MVQWHDGAIARARATKKVRHMALFLLVKGPKKCVFDAKCYGLTCKNVLPVWAGSTFSKKCEKIVHVVENWTKKRQDGGCNACVGGLGPFAHGRTQFYPSESNKTRSRPTTAIGRGAGE